MTTWVAVVGCRRYKNYLWLSQQLDEILAPIQGGVTIVTGDATGVDSLAVEYANEHNLQCVIHRADWSVGRKAGPLRNGRIVSDSDIVIAFPSMQSVGTHDTIHRAKSVGKQCFVIPLPT